MLNYLSQNTSLGFLMSLFAAALSHVNVDSTMQFMQFLGVFLALIIGVLTIIAKWLEIKHRRKQNKNQ